MANKYDLCLVPTVSDRTPKPRPWYKEKIRAKLMTCRIGATSSSWRFVNENTVDFRNGPPAAEPLVIKGKQELAPVVGAPKPVPSWKLAAQKMHLLPHGVARRASSSASAGSTDLLVELSTTQQRGRRSRLHQLQELEEGLRDKQNSLEFEQFLSDLNEEISDDVASTEIDDERTMAQEQSVIESLHSNEGSTSGEKEFCAMAAVTEPDYSRLPRLGLSGGSSLMSGHQQLSGRQHSPCQKESSSEKITANSSMRKAALDDERLASVINQLCTWENGVGNVVKPTLDEVTVYHMFGMGNESKPAPDMSVKILDLSSLPADLRQGRGTGQTAASSVLPRLSTSLTAHTPLATASVPCQHMQVSPKANLEYGAWYLPKSLWSVRHRGEPLEDPLKQKRREEEERERQQRRVPGSDEMMAKIRHFSQNYRAKYAFHHPT